MRIATALFSLVLTVSITTNARGQGARSGVWMNAGVAYGSTSVECEPCTLDREALTGFHLRFGVSRTHRVTWGGEVHFLSTDQDSTYVSVLSVLGIVQFYPIDAAGLYFSAGAGLYKSRFEYLTAPPGLRDFNNRATGVQVGAGYEIPLASGLSLTPFTSFIKDFGGGTTEYNGNRIDEAINPNFFQFGVGLTWH